MVFKLIKKAFGAVKDVFSGAAKTVKKQVSGIAKSVKKVVSGIVKAGKKVVGKVGKALGKLGPIGTIAIGFLAPYALGALAGSSIGWVSTIGKTLQAVQATAAAPFQAIGKVVGAGVSQLGGGLSTALGGSSTAIGTGIQTVTDKIVALTGYEGGKVMTEIGDVFKGVKNSWTSIGSDAVAPGLKTPSPEKDLGFKSGEYKLDTSDFSLKEKSKSLLDYDFESGTYSTDASKFTLSPPATTRLDVAQAITPEFSGAGSREDYILAGDEYATKPFLSTPTPSPTTTTSSTDKVAKAALKSLLSPSPVERSSIVLPTPNTDMLTNPTSPQGRGRGVGSSGFSFYAQQLTGLSPSEELAQQSYALLSRGYA